MKLVKAMLTVGGLTGLSRIAGFIRDVLMARILGAGPISDAFFVALKLPNFFRRVTAEGAFSVAFVPLYSEKIEKDGRGSADAFASNAFVVMGLILSVFTVLALMAMPYIINLIAPGFEQEGERYVASIELSRISFPYLLLMSLTALLGGVLNALNRFAPFAFAPVLFNICLITALLVSGAFSTVGHALSYGIIAAGLLQLIFLIICAKRAGVALKIKRPQFNGDIKRIFKLMGPGVIGAGVMHVNLFADMIIASFLQEGSISYLYYADRLNQLPLGVVGIAVGTALLPMLSRSVAAGQNGQAVGLFNRAMEYCFLFAFPAALALGAFSFLIISVLFEHGAFGAGDAVMTSYVLMGYVVGLPAYIATKVFSTVHWAHQDTKTPVRIAIITTLVNIALSLLLIRFIDAAGISLATGLCGWLQYALHMKALKKREGFSFDAKFKANLMKIIAGTFMMLILCALIQYGFNIVVPPMEVLSGWLLEFVELALVVGGGVIFYGVWILKSGVADLSALKLRRR